MKKQKPEKKSLTKFNEKIINKMKVQSPKVAISKQKQKPNTRKLSSFLIKSIKNGSKWKSAPKKRQRVGSCRTQLQKRNILLKMSKQRKLLRDLVRTSAVNSNLSESENKSNIYISVNHLLQKRKRESISGLEIRNHVTLIPSFKISGKKRLSHGKYSSRLPCKKPLPSTALAADKRKNHKKLDLFISKRSKKRQSDKLTTLKGPPKPSKQPSVKQQVHLTRIDLLDEFRPSRDLDRPRSFVLRPKIKTSFRYQSKFFDMIKSKKRRRTWASNQNNKSISIKENFRFKAGHEEPKSKKKKDASISGYLIQDDACDRHFFSKTKSILNKFFGRVKAQKLLSSKILFNLDYGQLQFPEDRDRPSIQEKILASFPKNQIRQD